MAKLLFQAGAWIKHRYSSGNHHSLHSPFLFDWYNKVVRNTENWSPSEVPEKIRGMFLNDNRTDQGEDHGQGNSTKRKVRDYAKNSLGSSKKLSTLFRMVTFHSPISILELGTCLGVSAAYLAEGNSTKVSTIEGNEFLADLAKKALKEQGYDIRVVKGQFDEKLSRELEKLHLPWFIFLDGNHSLDATIRYFEMIVERATQDCVLVLDDIHWSKGMEEAWNRIIEDKRVPLSVDLFDLGVVFFRFNQPKQHFILR